MGIVGLSAAAIALAFLVAGGSKPRSLIIWSVVLLVLAVLTISLFTFLFACTLFVSAVVLGHKERSRLTRTRVVLSLATLPILLVVSMVTIRVIKGRMEYPYESIRDRVQVVNQSPLVVENQEADDAEEPRIMRWRDRRAAIASLHRSAVSHFLTTPEFGVTRMGYPSLRNLEHGDGSPIELPSNYEDSEAEYSHFAEAQQMPSESQQTQLEDGHQHFRSWFLDPNRFGHVEDLDHVAGFLSHAIVQSPRSRWDNDIQPFQRSGEDARSDPMVLRKLQLVGLLYHNEPVVYELDTLPELVSASSAETRPLNSFEQRGLVELLRGQPIHAEMQGEHMYMLGALRSSNSCAECHEGPTNQLLGAFTYVLEAKDAGDEPAAGFPLTLRY